jgi:hypothetical protein
VAITGASGRHATRVRPVRERACTGARPADDDAGSKCAADRRAALPCAERVRIVDELRLVDQDAVGPRQRVIGRAKHIPRPCPRLGAPQWRAARGRSSPTTCCAALPSRWRRRSEARQVASPTLGIRTELTGLTDFSRELPVIQTDEPIQAAFRLQAPGDGRRQRRRGHLARGNPRALEADARGRPDDQPIETDLARQERWPRSTSRSRATGGTARRARRCRRLREEMVPATVGTLPGADVAATGRSPAAPTSTQ